MHIRRRTGRSRTTMEMEKYGAVLAVFSNIENEEYIKTRTFPQSPLITSDSERPGILREFIRLIDDAFEDISDL